MPSIADIPERLRRIPAKEQFLEWLRGIPAEPWVKRQVLRSWREYNNVPLVKEDYEEAGLI